jgi:hypothetical protein
MQTRLPPPAPQMSSGRTCLQKRQLWVPPPFALIAAKFPEGSKLAIDRCSDGQKSGGFVWHREAADRPGQIGLRGTLYAELDDAGKLCYVQEGCEPIVKPGEATEALLKAATANMEKPEKPPPTFTQETPTTASGIVRESDSRI